MKTGHLLLGAGLAASAAVAAFGDRTPAGAIAEPVARAAPGDPAAAPTPTPSRADKSRPAPTVAALRPRAELLRREGAEIFASQTFDPPPPPPPRAPEVASAPPVAPALPFTYLGKKLDDAKWEVWLAIGDQTLYVREGSVVEHDYAVNSIRPPLLTLTYLPLKQMQTMTIGGAE